MVWASFNGCCQQPLKTQTWAPFKKLAVAALSKLKIKARARRALLAALLQRADFAANQAPLVAEFVRIPRCSIGAGRFAGVQGAPVAEFNLPSKTKSAAVQWAWTAAGQFGGIEFELADIPG
ncbi:MAG TPA: hypothetical protein VND64_04030 [Pirellulales bacterium]|nr:hypothetical protein [Pirellulales bacterium]